MIDVKYIGKLDAQDKRWYDYVCKWKGSCREALDAILNWIDCSKIYPNGDRPMMTIHYGYRTDIAGFIYIHNKTVESGLDTLEGYMDRLIARHEENLNFEEHTPPINYRKKQGVSSRNTRRNVESKRLFSNEENAIDVGDRQTIKRENATTRKAKALKDKSISFAFNNFKINK